MDHAHHVTHNKRLGRPADMGPTECDSLTVRDDYFVGRRCVVSHWRPTDAEIEALKSGALIALCVLGDTMPPVALWLEAP